MPDAASSPLAGAAPAADPAERYFGAIAAALDGLDIFMRDDRSPLYRHDLVAKIVAGYIARLESSFSCWRNRLGFMERFRISRAESGFPVFQNVLELENDRRQAPERLAQHPRAGRHCGPRWPTSSCATRSFRRRCRGRWRSGSIWRTSRTATIFGPFTLAETAKVSVNPKTMRPFYLVHWATFDGSANLPLIYMATVEDSSEAMVAQLVDEAASSNEKVEIPLPVDGLLNPELAHRFDDFTEKNSAYSLSPATIASNLDKDFETLHPKQLRRFVLGPFYSAGITENNSVVAEVLSKVRRPENAWLLTWTLQEVFSQGRETRPPRPVVERQGDAGVLHQYRRPGSGAAGRVELREACADPARGLSGALCRGRGAEDLRGLQGAHPVQGPGDQRRSDPEADMDTGLTTIPEADIEKHRATAQAMITRIVVLESGGSPAPRLPAPAGVSFRPFQPAAVRKTREVELAKTMPAVRPTIRCCPSPSTRCCFGRGAGWRSRWPSPMCSPGQAI